MFELHYLITRDGAFYDPSYGKKYLSLLAWENDNVAGYWHATYFFPDEAYMWEVGRDDGTWDHLEVVGYDPQ